MKKIFQLLSFGLFFSALLLTACGGESSTNPADNTTYTVTYDGNVNTGGSVPVDSTEYSTGAIVTVLGNTGNLVKTGHTFAGWNTASDGSGTTYTTGMIFTIGTSDVTLYAKWVIGTTYSVIYDGNGETGGSVPVDNTGYEADTTVTVLGNTGNLVKTGHTFAGWNTSSDGSGTDYSNGTTFTMGYADVTLYAKWTAGNISRYKYIAGGQGLKIIDISDPSNPTLAGSYNTSGLAQGICVSGNYAYIADFVRGFLIIDVSDPYNPTLVGNYDTKGVAYGVFVKGNCAFIADGSNGLVIINISDPSNPTLS